MNTNKNTSRESKRIAKVVPPANITKMIHGKVKWFDIRKGIGFIVADDGSEHFIYHSHIAVGRTYTGLEAGDDVNYRVQVNPNTGRQQAVNVMLNIDDDETTPLPVSPEVAQKILSSKCAYTKDIDDDETTDIRD